MCAGIASSGGAGKALAEWIVNDGPTMDLWTVDIRRFSSQVHNNPKFLSSRVAETLGLHYQITWPKRELVTGRGLRRSPLFDHHRKVGACFGSKFGWERVNFYAPEKDFHLFWTPTVNGAPGGVSMEPYSFGRQWWFDHVRREHTACREGAALFDITSFSKILIQGPHVVPFLQEMCVNNMDVPVGKLVYTTMCNDRGGVESDLTFCRLASDKFLAITSTAQATRDLDWMQSRLSCPEPRFVTLTDVTSSEAVLSLMGPLARRLLLSLSDADLSDEALPFGSSKRMDIGLVNVRAHRISYVGEMGYELYVPTESAVLLYDTLHEGAREEHIPLTNAGYFAIDSLRLEKGYRAWGHDVTPNETPLEAGLGFAIDWSKPEQFIGRAALERQRAEGVRRRLVCVMFDSEEAGEAHPYPYGGEPLFRDGQLVGYLTSAGYGYSLERAVGLAYVSKVNGVGGAGRQGAVDAKWVREGHYEVQIADKKHRVSVSLKPFFDPKGTRMAV
jgi:glycine cleavage system aminomethyltransferase T